MDCTINKSFVPYRLTQARKFRGKTMTELADEISKTSQVVSQYENGKTDPSYESIEKISKFLNFKIPFFYKPIVNINTTLFFRDIKKNTKSMREKLISASQIIQEMKFEIDKMVNFPALNLGGCDNLISESGYDLTEEMIASIANKLRQHWKLGYGPISNMVNLLENNGIIVLRNFFDSFNVDGVSWWANNTPFIILSEDKDNGIRSRFDIAHELGHIILHKNISDIENLNTEDFKRIEKEANIFASNFLMPQETFSREVVSVAFDNFIALKKRWKVSIASMLYKSKDLKLINENQYKYLLIQLNSKKKYINDKKEPLDDIFDIERPVLFKKAITGLLQANLLDLDCLDIPQEDFYNLFIPQIKNNKIVDVKPTYH